jgi:glycosyltransferase involved in cell wall biosynthesis
MRSIPGELHERVWVNFAHNRTQSLELAKPHGDFILIIDADDVLELSPGFKQPLLDADSYEIEIRHKELHYWRTQLIRGALPWRYEGVLHEFLSCGFNKQNQRVFPENRSQQRLLGATIRVTDEGARRRSSDAVRYSRDAAILEKALATERDPFLISRYRFYVAQSYLNCGVKEKALENYLIRTDLGFWDQEVFISLYEAGRLKEQLGYPVDDILAILRKASEACSARAEALHAASRLCRVNKRFAEGYEFACRGLKIPLPAGGLFLESWIYEYGLLDELAVNAYWVERYKECLEACERLLREEKCPANMRERVEQNARFARKKLSPEKAEMETDSANAVAAPASSLRAKSTPLISTNLHLLGVAHTIPHEDYLVCAFTAKILLFPEVIQPFGWHVVEYTNEGSASEAREHVVVLTEDRLRALSRRRFREEPLDADVNNTELRQEFQRILVEKIRSRARPGDIVCHVWGPNMEVYNLLPDCRHIELCVGYTASPGLPFRIYETSAWMHWHYGKAGQEDGNNYKWVIPSPIDTDKWSLCEDPHEYALFLGRVTSRKGIDTLVEIARRVPELAIHVHGPGDPSQWVPQASSNLIFKGPVFGDERVDVVRRAYCMLMPTVFIEPFGNSGIEAQLCGVPLIGTSYGAFQETILEGVTGYRCHTLADWVEAIRLSTSLDRRQIAALARSKYSKEVVGKQYNWVLRQLADLSGRGWYGEKSRKFADATFSVQAPKPRQRRIWLYSPYFGTLPNYFQLFLDSLGRNADCLSVFLMTDIDLSGYRVPENLITIPMTLDSLRETAARFVSNEFQVELRPDALLKQPYKLCDFKIMYPELFKDFSERYGVTEDDFVGWGDCDVIYGRFSDFLNMDDDYHIIGGFHGHLTAFRNTDSFRKLFRVVTNLQELLIDEKSHIVDEIAFRKPILDFLERNQFRMFYINRYFCDIIPECFFGLFRPDYQQRKKNFFEGYHPEKDIHHLYYDRDGRLTVVYDDGESRQAIYCHLQKRAMSIDFNQHENGYYIHEEAFSLTPRRALAEPMNASERTSGL